MIHNIPYLQNLRKPRNPGNQFRTWKLSPLPHPPSPTPQGRVHNVTPGGGGGRSGLFWPAPTDYYFSELSSGLPLQTTTFCPSKDLPSRDLP